MNALLEVADVSHSFGGVHALRNISFDVQDGEQFGIIGPNGAGKTTLLNVISNVLRGTVGTVTYRGRDINRLRAHRIAALGISRTFQAADFFSGFTVEDYLMAGRLQFQSRSLFATATRLPSARRNERAERTATRARLEATGLGAIATHSLQHLPYGTRKVVDVVRALHAEADLILLDEPTSGTTSADRERLRGLLRDVRREGSAVVVVDHDTAFVSDVCDRAMAMDLGARLAVAPPRELMARHDVIESYLGGS